MSPAPTRGARPPRRPAPRRRTTPTLSTAGLKTTRPVQVPLWSTMPPARRPRTVGVSRQRSAPDAIPRPQRRPEVGPTTPVEAFSRAETTLLDLVDNLLNRGVVLTGDAILGVANVDLVYLRLSALLAAADRVLGGGRRG
jgi:hypothetical protein